MKQQPVICLMGPTASGKTALAVEIVRHFPCEIISVDSAMVYRGMDIGTAKPDAEILRIAPHRLIDICDPVQPYSAGQFRNDALREIENIVSRNKIPLLVGGTMLYFRVLQQGLAELPPANATVRKELQTYTQQHGVSGLHAWLAQVDVEAAARINPHDTQRLQRALEVYLVTGKNITTWQQEKIPSLARYAFQSLGLQVEDRASLRERISLRFETMLAEGLVEEVRSLYDRGDLTAELPSMRSVGYRQVWDYLSGLTSFEDMREQAVTATRQLAKRQITWLRTWPNLQSLDADSAKTFDQAAYYIDKITSIFSIP